MDAAKPKMTTTRVQKYGAHGSIGAINMIVVIESLRAGDWKTGRALRDDLEIIALPHGNNLQIHYKTAHDADELEFLLRELNAYVSLSGRAPCLHIECHGDKDGLELSDGSRMPWSRLKPLLVEINRTSRMNLFLVLACCDGAYFLPECRYHETVPFAWMFGPTGEIGADPILALSGALYTELLKGSDITSALTIGGVARPAISYASMSAVGVFRIALKARIKGTPPELRAQVRAVEEPLFDQWRRTYFALDEYPQNTDRFAVTYAQVLAEVEAGA
jgi:hypothetical protein